MFSAILGLASGVAGIFSATSQYNIAMEELALKRKALRDQKDMAMLNYGMGQDQLRREREQEAYLRQYNEENQRLAAQEYQQRLAQFEQRKQQALAERQYVMERQVAMDKEAAKRQAFMLEQFLQNQNLAAEERAYAEEQLQIARATAAGERDEDLMRLRRQEEMAAIEREFAIEEMRRAQTIAMQERQDDYLFREDIIGRLDQMNAMIEGSLAGLPPLDAPELLGADDFEEILARFDANAIANVDRAVDRVASQTEGDLMTRGLQHSSIGQSARSDIARRMALDYDNASQAAMQSALQYIAGQNDIVLQDYNARKDARGSRMAEIQAMTMPTVEAMMNMRPLTSANQYNLPVGISSGIVDRGVVSANDYSSPVPFSSAIFNQSDIGFGMADFLSAPSIADAFVYNAGTAQTQPMMWGISSPSGFFGNATSGLNSVAQGYNAQPWMDGYSRHMGGALGALGHAVGNIQHTMRDAGSGGGSAMSPVLPMSAPVPYSAYPTLPSYAPIPTARPSYGGAGGGFLTNTMPYW